MNETNELPVPIPDDDGSALVGSKREESREWVINTYRKHQKVKTSSWLDNVLGEGHVLSPMFFPFYLTLIPFDTGKVFRNRFSLHQELSMKIC